MADDVPTAQALGGQKDIKPISSSLQATSPNPGTADGQMSPPTNVFTANTARHPRARAKLRDAKIELPARG